MNRCATPGTRGTGSEKHAAGDVLTVMVIAISLTLPSVCYMVYKNVSTAASQYYPTPQITVYLEKTLDDDAAARVVGQLQAEQGVEKVNYLSRDEALGEFRNWSGFGGALDMLEENPLPAVAIVVPKIDFQSVEALNTLQRPREPRAGR